MTNPNIGPGGAPIVPYEQLSLLEQQATLCSLAQRLPNNDFNTAWGGTPRTPDEQKALYAAHKDEAGYLAQLIHTSPLGYAALPAVYPPAPVAAASAAKDEVPDTTTQIVSAAPTDAQPVSATGPGNDASTPQPTGNTLDSLALGQSVAFVTKSPEAVAKHKSGIAAALEVLKRDFALADHWAVQHIEALAKHL